MVKAKAILDYLLKNLISIIALAISLLLLCKDYLNPFSLSVRAVGRVTLSKNPWSEGLRQSCIHIDLVFSNHGAKRGIVEDIAIELRSGKNQIFLRSLAIIRDRSLNLGKELLPPAMETFIGFELGKSESTVKRVLLVPHEKSPISDFQAQEYSGTIWVKHSKDKNWIKASSFSYLVTSEDLAVLAKTTITPQLDGRFYINWVIRDTVLKQTEESIVGLWEKLKSKKE